MAAQEPGVADRRGGVDRCGREGDPQPVVGERAVEAGEGRAGLVAPAGVGEDPGPEPADRCGVGRVVEHRQVGERPVGARPSPRR